MTDKRTYSKLADDLAEFYAKLLAAQKPIDPEVEKVLYDNLTELYEKVEQKT